MEDMKMKKNMIFSGAMSMMTALLLCTACSSDDVTADKAAAAVPEGKVIHYTATVGEGDETRATLNSSKKYEFQTDDKLVITGTNISGELTLKAGDEGKSSNATFEGDLTYEGDGTPAADLELKAVLVSTSNAMTTLTYSSAEYPTTAVASTLAEAVEKYSHFIGTSSYADKSFSLSQQTSFLNFTVTLTDGTATNNGLNVTIKNGGSTVRTGRVTTATDASSNVVAQFVAAMPKGTTMSSATVKLSTKDAISFGGITMLAANKIYNIEKTISTVVGTAVDLGLPSGVKWANMNVGATSETGDGLYFAWGATTGYTGDSGHECIPQNTPYYTGDGTNHSWSKYTGSDGLTVLEATDDAATVNWGGNWRMPTAEEITELLNNTNNGRTTINGVGGWKFTNRSDASKYIFLRATGWLENSSLQSPGWANYFTSTLNLDNADYSYHLFFNESNYIVVQNNGWRDHGNCYAIRPVQSN